MVKNRFKHEDDDDELALLTAGVQGPEPQPEPEPVKSSAKEELLAGIIEKKPTAKSYGFYLDDDVVTALEKLAKQNKTSKSKLLNTLLRNLLLKK